MTFCVTRLLRGSLSPWYERSEQESNRLGLDAGSIPARGAILDAQDVRGLASNRGRGVYDLDTVAGDSAAYAVYGPSPDSQRCR